MPPGIAYHSPEFVKYREGFVVALWSSPASSIEHRRRSETKVRNADANVNDGTITGDSNTHTRRAFPDSVRSYHCGMWSLLRVGIRASTSSTVYGESKSAARPHTEWGGFPSPSFEGLVTR